MTLTCIALVTPERTRPLQLVMLKNSHASADVLMMDDVFIEMASSAVKRPAPNIPPKPAPRRRPTSDTTPEASAVVTGNGNAGGHDVTSSASSSTDESIQLIAELPDERRVTLFVDARYSYTSKAYHNCDSTTIRLRHDYDEKMTC